MHKKMSLHGLKAACTLALVCVPLSPALGQTLDWASNVDNVAVVCVGVAEAVHVGWQGMVPTPGVWKTIGIEFRTNEPGKPEAELRYRCEHTNNSPYQEPGKYFCGISAQSGLENRPYRLEGSIGTIELKNGERNAGRKVCESMFTVGNLKIKRP